MQSFSVRRLVRSSALVRAALVAVSSRLAISGATAARVRHATALSSSGAPRRGAALRRRCGGRTAPRLRARCQGRLQRRDPRDPFGFSTTQSFVWATQDQGNSYQFVPGIIGPGKPATCAGGGDSESCPTVPMRSTSQIFRVSRTSLTASVPMAARPGRRTARGPPTHPMTGCGLPAPVRWRPEI